MVREKVGEVGREKCLERSLVVIFRVMDSSCSIRSDTARHLDMTMCTFQKYNNSDQMEQRR